MIMPQNRCHKFIGRISAGQKHGTAFLITDSYALTARHVISDLSAESEKYALIYFPDLDEPIRATVEKVVAQLDDEDWSLLKLENSESLMRSPPNLLPLKELKSSGVEWWAHSYSNIKPDSGFTYSGTVQQISNELGNSKVIQLYSDQIRNEGHRHIPGNPTAGMSGSPVVVEGNIVGLITDTLGADIPIASTAFAIPIQTIVENLPPCINLPNSEGGFSANSGNPIRGKTSFSPPDRQPILFRDKELNIVRRYLIDEETFRCVLTGPKGVGKTAIAEHLANEVKQQAHWSKKYSAAVWISFRKKIYVSGDVYLSNSAVSSINELFWVIGNELVPDLDLGLVEPQNQATTLIDHMEQTPTLIFLDNFEEILDQESEVNFSYDRRLKEFISRIPKGSTILITSSVEPPSSLFYKNIPIPRLENADALSYLGEIRKYSGRMPNIDLDRELVKACFGLPILLEWAIGQVEDFSDSTLADISNIKDEEELIQFLFKIPHNTFERKILIVLAILQTSVSFYDITKIVNLSNDTVAKALRNLHRRFLLDQVHKGFYGLLPITQHLTLVKAAEKHKEELEENQQTVIYWVRDLILLYRNWENNDADHSNLRSRIEMLSGAIRLYVPLSAIDSEERFECVTTILSILILAGHWGLHEEIIKEQIEYFRQLDSLLVIKLYILLGRQLAHQRRSEESLDSLQAALQLMDVNDIQAFRCEALMRQGNALTHTKPEQALKVLGQALKENPSDNEKLSISGYKADCLIQLGRYSDAISIFENDVCLSNAFVQWPRASGYLYSVKGDAYCAIGELDKARECYNFAHKIGEKWEDRRLELLIELGLAECNASLNQLYLIEEAFKSLQMNRELRRLAFIRDMILKVQERPWKIITIGAPAAGKTTLCETLLTSLNTNYINLEYLSLDKIHRELQNEGDVNYRIETDGSITLLDQKQAETALELLSEKVMEYSNDFMIEIAHEDLDFALTTLSESTVIGSMLVIACANEQERVKRNESRTGSKIPEKIVRNYSDKLSDIKLKELRDHKIRVIAIDTNDEKSNVINHFLDLISKHLNIG